MVYNWKSNLIEGLAKGSHFLRYNNINFPNFSVMRNSLDIRLDNHWFRSPFKLTLTLVDTYIRVARTGNIVGLTGARL